MAEGGRNGAVFDVPDMRAPVLSDLQKAALEGAAQMRFDFSAEAILTAAKAQTGLTDFGPMDFVERLALWCQCVKEDACLSPVSHAALWTMFLRYASDRLKIEDLCKRHPEILDIQIDRPIIGRQLRRRLAIPMHQRRTIPIRAGRARRQAGRSKTR